MNVVKLESDLPRDAETVFAPIAKPANFSSKDYHAAVSGGDLDHALPVSASRFYWAAVDFRSAMHLANLTGKEDDFIQANYA